MNKYVLGFAFFKKWVLLIEKKRPEWQKGLLNGVGGEMENNEPPAQAMHREFKEETGIDIPLPNCVWKHVITLVSTEYDSIVYVFRVKFEFDFTSMLKQTDERSHLCEVGNMYKPVVPDLNWMIPLMLSDVEFPITVIENKVICDSK